MTAQLPVIPACLLPPDGTLPATATSEDVRFSHSVEDFMPYLGAGATMGEKYQVRMWWGQTKEALRLAEKQADRQRDDEARRGAYAETDAQGIPRHLKSYSDGTPFMSRFARRWGARAGLNNQPPPALSNLRTAFEPDLYPVLGQELDTERIMATVAQFLGPLRAKGGGLIVYCDNREKMIRRWLDQAQLTMRAFGLQDPTKWQTAEGADELRRFLIHAIEGLRDEFVMMTVKMAQNRLVSPAQNALHPALPYYLTEAIEADRKKTEQLAKEQRAEAARKAQERGHQGRWGPRRGRRNDEAPRRIEPTPIGDGQKRGDGDRGGRGGNRDRGGRGGNRGGGGRGGGGAGFDHKRQRAEDSMVDID